MDTAQTQVKSEFKIEMRAPHVLEVISTGFGEVASIDQLEKAVFAALAKLPSGKQRLHIFWDTSRLDGYAPAFRQRTIALFRAMKQRNNLLSVQAYVQSKLVQMGAQVAAMLLETDIRCYSQELAYRGALRAAMTERL